MSAGAVIACRDQALAARIRVLLDEIDDLTVLAVAETAEELVRLVVERDPEVVVVHDEIAPGSVHAVVRDLSLRRPASPVVMITDGSSDSMGLAMDSGVRSVLRLPLDFEDVRQRVLAAIDWSRHLQRLLAGGRTVAAPVSSRAQVVTVTGAKGGVGATTVATHLAWRAATATAPVKTLLVDLDLEKGDVTGLIEAKYRISIADLGKVADDLSTRTVLDAVFEHEAGVNLLLPPEDVRDVEWVTPQAVREIVALLRDEYDLIVIDAGAHVTPLQLAAVELADTVLTIVTPDLVALRALRRELDWWDSLGARKPADVRVLVNRTSRAREVQPRTVQQLSPAPVLDTTLPDAVRQLEPSVNSRSPELVADAKWWQHVGRLADEIASPREPEPAPEPAQAPDQDAEGSGAEQPPMRRPRESGRRSRRRRRGDEGAASVELLGVLPAVLLVVVIMWQLALAGATWVWTGYAAADAAREVSIGATEQQVRAAAMDRLPAAMAGRAHVSSRGDRVVVDVPVPLIAPGVAHLPWTVRVEREVVMEP